MLSLADIEDLVERCRTKRARSLIKEAVDCYRAGAYRACVIATWIALVYDIIDKLRDISLSGDPQAQKDVAHFDLIQVNRDTDLALKFEREVLDIAKDRYELISAQEYADLKRLFDDRNRFGHPNLNQDLEAIRATPEQARAHLRNAIEHVLEHPPVQGKSALATLQQTTDSEYFPTDLDAAIEALKGSPIVRAKKNLVRDYFLGCTSSVLLEKLSSEKVKQRIAAARATFNLHPAIVKDVASERLPAIYDKVPDNRIGYIVALIFMAPELAYTVTEAQKIRLRQYIQKTPEQDLTILPAAINIGFIREDAEQKIQTLDIAQVRSALGTTAREPDRFIVLHTIKLLESSRSFDSANNATSLIQGRFTKFLDKEDATRILRSGVNDEVKHSYGYPKLIKHLMSENLLADDLVREVSVELGLGQVLA